MHSKPSFGAAFDFGVLVCLLSGGEFYQSDSGVESNSLIDGEYLKCVPCLVVTRLSVKVVVLRIASINRGVLSVNQAFLRMGEASFISSQTKV